jgi:hypothetical protein
MRLRSAHRAGSSPAEDVSVVDGILGGAPQASAPRHPNLSTAARPSGLGSFAAAEIVKLVVAAVVVAGFIAGWAHVTSDDFRLRCGLHHAAHALGEPDPMSFPDNVLCEAFH